jgi:hypothetical protein
MRVCRKKRLGSSWADATDARGVRYRSWAVRRSFLGSTLLHQRYSISAAHVRYGKNKGFMSGTLFALVAYFSRCPGGGVDFIHERRGTGVPGSWNRGYLLLPVRTRRRSNNSAINATIDPTTMPPSSPQWPPMGARLPFLLEAPPRRCRQRSEPCTRAACRWWRAAQSEPSAPTKGARRGKSHPRTSGI